jgi:hypothetical protein
VHFTYCYDVACRQNDQTKKATQIITYHLGRYGVCHNRLCFLVCLEGFFLAGLQQNLSIFIGVAMIVVSLIPENFYDTIFSKPVLN